MPTLKKPTSIATYLATVQPAPRKALKNLAAQIRTLYPATTEHIAYGRPLFKLDGHPLAGFQATKHHLSLFVWSGTALGTLGKRLAVYDTGMGTIRFTEDKPLPLGIVKAVLAARVKEIRARWPRKSSKRA